MAQASSYDKVPYDSQPFPLTHPDHLSSLATLFGLAPPPVERCRVMELGCASGGNLIPMAVALPDSTFVGVDLSARQIEAGAGVVGRLGLKNIELRAMSILDVGEDFGAFDYVICHGVYSWVPPPVQEKILEIFSRHLGPDGVGYVSYNTYPGWHVRGLIRDMMCYHARAFPTAAEQIEQARALLGLLALSCRGENDPYRQLLAREAETLSKAPDSYVYHEHLEECNEPLYFHQFVGRLRRHGLSYLGDADLRSMGTGDFPQEVRDVLREVAGDQIDAEQYADFLRNRTFRQSLVCHGRHRPSYALSAKSLSELLIASPLKPRGARPDLAGPTTETFQTPAGLQWASGEPIVKAALLHLADCWPAPVPFAGLAAAARKRLMASPQESDGPTLGQALLDACVRLGHGGVELHRHRGRFVTEVGTRPTASPLARLQAAQGGRVTTLRHEQAVLGEFERQLLLLLDGEHGRPELLARALDMVSRGALVVRQNDQPVTQPQEARRLVSRTIDEQLERLARAALLIA